MAQTAPPGKCLLVLDDDPDMADAVAQFLRERLPMSTVLAAYEPADGLQLLGTHRIDLMVVDYHMPGMDGTQFLEKAERIAPGIPHILVTAYLPEVMASLGPNLRDNLILQKPFNPEALLSDVIEALDPMRNLEDP